METDRKTEENQNNENINVEVDKKIEDTTNDKNVKVETGEEMPEKQKKEKIKIEDKKTKDMFNKNNMRGDFPKRNKRKLSPSARNRKRNLQTKSSLEKRIIATRRVARVVAGGRRFTLSVAVAVGDKKGKVGVGIGRGLDMAQASEKAYNKAQKNMQKVNITDDQSIKHDIQGKFCASSVLLKPASGFVAGGSVRTIVELAGIRNINAKLLSRSKSHINNALATIKALKKIK